MTGRPEEAEASGAIAVFPNATAVGAAVASLGAPQIVNVANALYIEAADIDGDGKVDLALGLLAALRLAPYDPEPSARLAVLFAVGGRYRDAASYFERAYRIRPSAELAQNAGRAWSLAGDGTRARYWEALR